MNRNRIRSFAMCSLNSDTFTRMPLDLCQPVLQTASIGGLGLAYLLHTRCCQVIATSEEETAASITTISEVLGTKARRSEHD